MKRRHDPERTCLGCGRRDKQKDLIRIAAGNDGVLRLERRGVGRGGYLHKSEECWKGFLRRKKIYQAFHREIPREAREKLITNLRSYLGDDDGKDKGPFAGQGTGNRD